MGAALAPVAAARLFRAFFADEPSKLRVRVWLAPRPLRVVRPPRVVFDVLVTADVPLSLTDLDRLAPFCVWLFDIDADSASLIVACDDSFCSSKGSGSHFCFPFFFRVWGVFDCDGVPDPFSLEHICSVLPIEDSFFASARLGQSCG